MLFRSPKISERFKDEAMLRADLILNAYRRMGCHAFNIGVHDLAMGKDYLLEKQKTVNFPFISANLIDKRTGELLFQPYVIKEVGKSRIGVFGLMTTEVKLDQSAPDLRVDVPIEMAKRVVEKLKSKCDLIIALTQLGYQQDIKLAEQVTGINFIVDGSGKGFPFRQKQKKLSRVNDTVILQASNRGRHLGRLDLVSIDNSYKFANYSEKLNILSELERIQDQIKHFSEELSPSSDIKKIKKALKNLDKVKKHLEEVQGSSHYIGTEVILNDSIKGNPDIEMMVKQHKKDAARMRQKFHRIPAQKQPDADNEMGQDEDIDDEGMLDLTP